MERIEASMDVLIFCGLQAAGKSTFYREHFLTTHALISKDLMPNTARPARRQMELLHLALQTQHSVVIDNTNPTPTERVPLIEIAHNYQARVIGYYFASTAQQALERNLLRAGKANVPAVAIYSTAAKLVAPTYAEGFDTLYYVRIAENSAATAPAWRIEEIAHDE